MKNQINTTILLRDKEIPVGIGSAILTTNEISFKTVHTCGTPVGAVKETSGGKSQNSAAKNAPKATAIQQRNFCIACNSYVEETAKGFEYAKGRYAILTQEEIDSINPDVPKQIVITKFVPNTVLSPLLVEKNHFLIPNEHVSHGYAALYASLAGSGLIAIGTQNLWGKERPCAVYAEQRFDTRGVLMLQLLHSGEDLVEPDFEAPITTKEWLAEMIAITQEMTGELTEDDLASAQRARLNALIKTKIEEIENPPKDLVETLKPSRRRREKAKA